ncbi:MAG TPA: SRPBCC family protein [Micrococcaceae bacterium]|jgi:uncharacterized membrane protein|nr:SRPBCC family protein [Micrococcaceae bacterium]
MVDVQTVTVIARPCREVAAYAADPDNAPRWYRNIRSAQWRSAPPLQLGSEVAFTARFLGRELAYVYRITELVPGEKLVMRTVQGPFPMQTSYTWAAVDESSTRMTLRNSGEPSGFSRVLAPLMATMMRRATRQDLKRLKAILESRERPSRNVPDGAAGTQQTTAPRAKPGCINGRKTS